MRIAWVVPGGVDRSARERVIPALLWQIARLAARHDLHVVSLAGDAEGGDYPLLGATVHSSSPVAGTKVRWLWRTLCALGPLDVVHAFWAGRTALVAGACARRMGAPAVVSLGGGELVAIDDIHYGGALKRSSRLAVRASLALAAAVTVASGPMEELARKIRPDVRRIPLGVDARWLGSHQVSAPGPPWRLLHVGSINAVKDQATLLRAFGRVADEVREVSLDLVGEDTRGGELTRLARDLDLLPAVRFHGFRPLDEVVPLYRAAHLFVIASRHEAGPVAVLEAAACGVPTVGTAVGHVAEWAPDLACSVPARDPGALAQAIVGLLRDSAGRERMGAAARDWVVRHDADWTAAQFETLYQDIRRRHA